MCGFVHSKQHDSSIRIPSLYGSQNFACWFVNAITAYFRYQNDACLYCSQPSSVVLCVQNSDWLASELLVSRGSQPSSIGLLHTKQRLEDKNHKSLWVPDLTYGFFCIQNSVFSIRICKSLLVPDSHRVVLCIHNSDIYDRNCIVSIGPRPHLFILCTARQRD